MDIASSDVDHQLYLEIGLVIFMFYVCIMYVQSAWPPIFLESVMKNDLFSKLKHFWKLLEELNFLIKISKHSKNNIFLFNASQMKRFQFLKIFLPREDLLWNKLVLLK